VTALYQAVEIKGAKTRENSSNSYRSHANVFINYLEKAELETMPVDELEVYHVVDFMDHRKLNDKVRNNTVNNDIIHLGALFTELKERGFVLENVWHQVKKLPKERKHRRAFEPDEAQITIRHFYRHDPTLCLAILFQYCCFLRPNEIRQLKISDVDLDTGIIQVRPETGKTSKELHTRYATIPASYEPIFRELMPEGAGHNYIFGVGFKPGSAPCSKNRMYRRHKRGLKWLHEMGKLPDLKGLEFYSWKDTGITDAADMLPIVFVQDQAGHTDTKTTLMYRKRPKVNHHFRDMEKKLLL
jgi:integrase